MKILREFYNDNKDRFFGYLLRRTGDYQLAADAMQESFARYIERYSKVEPSVSLLYTIGRNFLNDNNRRQHKTTLFDEERHGGTFDQESVVMVREESRRVLKAIQQLEPDEADVLSLVVTSGLSYREIAELMGTTEANIKVKVHRSRLKLKNTLQTGES
ncbi:MAG: sigma-70 family RNA polymerase sigma factor [Desulforhopalus sp.]